MITKTTIPALLLVMTASAWAETDERIEKRFPASSDGVLVVDVGLGRIEVITHDRNEVAITAIRKVVLESKAAEEAFLRDYPVTFSQTGQTVSIRSAEKTKGGGWFGSIRTDAHYVITVPSHFDVRLNTAGGGISVRDLTGNVRANTSGGGLDFVRVHGSLDGQTSGGGISVTESAGSFKLHTSGGGITLDEVSGDIDGSTSGGAIVARFASAPSGAVKLESSGGGVTVRIPRTAAFDLDASTSGGEVSSDLPVALRGRTHKRQLQGTVNGGGQPVVLQSSGGGIDIRAL